LASPASSPASSIIGIIGIVTGIIVISIGLYIKEY
jgi:hypothetical protein